MKKFLLFLFILLSFNITIVLGADSIVITPVRSEGSNIRYILTITSNSSGNVTSSAIGNPIILEPGLIMELDFNPLTGTDQPTNGYNLYCKDGASGKDKWYNIGATLSNDPTLISNTKTPINGNGGLVYVSGGYYIIGDSMGADNKTIVKMTIKKSK